MDLGLLVGGRTNISIVSPQSRDFESAAGKEEKKKRGGICLRRRARVSNGKTEDSPFFGACAKGVDLHTGG